MANCRYTEPSGGRNGPADANLCRAGNSSPRALRGRRQLLWITLLAALPAACASPNPTLYTLAVVPGAEHTGAPHVIELRAIAIAHYLERSQIVRSSEDLRLDVLGGDWWGEPLDAMLGRILS